MKNLKKIIVAASLCAAIGATAIAGTLAYFTDVDATTNVFTAGDLNMDLVEDNWVEKNANILPGVTIPKDPKIVNGQDDGKPAQSTDAFVQLKLTLPTKLYEMSDLASSAFTGVQFGINDGWQRVNTATDGDNTILTYYYGTAESYWKVAANEPTTTLFDEIYFNETLNNDAMKVIQDCLVDGKLNINVEALAIQSTGLEAKTVEEMNNIFATQEFQAAK